MAGVTGGGPVGTGTTADGVVRRVVLGGSFTVWFATAGHSGVEHAVVALLGLALTMGTAITAWASKWSVLPWLGVVVLVAALILGTPPLPADTFGAVAVAATGVSLVWIVGTRALVKR